MRKLDRLAQEKYNGNKEEAIKYLMLYSTKAEINNFWHEWSEEEQKYASSIEKKHPKKRFIKDIIFWMAWLLCVPAGIIVAALDTAVIYKYGTFKGIALILVELGVLIWLFRKKIRATDIAIIIIMVALGIMSLIALVLSEAIREALIELIIYLKTN